MWTSVWLMCVQSDAMAAVDLYASFPFSANPSFDDGYLHGEIVRHLMKAQKYDDLRLKSSLIAFVFVVHLCC